MLEREAEKLGVREHVVFRGQFVSAERAARISAGGGHLREPYLNEAQVTSGALSYAMGAGAAVVSTPYWHAQELLADGRGRLFPFKDHAALSRTLLELLRLARGAAARAHRGLRSSRIRWRGRGSATPTSRSFAPRCSLPRGRPCTARGATAPRACSRERLPELSLDHLRRMTDDTGIIQHATYSVPARRTGYCVDDNARALIVAVHADRVQGSRQRARSSPRT